MHLTLAAAEVLQSIVDGGGSIEQGIESVERRFDGNLSALKEIAFGGCRFYVYLNFVVNRLLDKPLKNKNRRVHFVLVSSLYQLMYMSTPAHAVVNESVKSIADGRFSWAKNLVNAVLRKFLREQQTQQETVRKNTARNNTARENFGLEQMDIEPHIQYAIPHHLYTLIRQDWPDHYQSILSAFNEKPPLTLRVNRQSITRSDYSALLSDADIPFTLGTHSETTIHLDQPRPVHEIPGFLQGQVSVQDESAQLVVNAMELQPGQIVLDGCAAPGGKTCLILESEPELAAVIAVDLPARTAAIHGNLERLKLAAVVKSADLTDTHSWWDGQLFDGILLDVPCSGSGVIRRHPDIKLRRRSSDILKFAQQQQRLLHSVTDIIKPGGILLYVTCSIFAMENDQVIANFLNDHTDFNLQSLPEEFGDETSYGRQRLPGIHSGDGFYYCKLGKSRKSEPEQ